MRIPYRSGRVYLNEHLVVFLSENSFALGSSLPENRIFTLTHTRLYILGHGFVRSMYYTICRLYVLLFGCVKTHQRINQFLRSIQDINIKFEIQLDEFNLYLIIYIMPINAQHHDKIL